MHFTLSQSPDIPRRRGLNPSSRKSASHWQFLFYKFCASSTIHGTYFWAESKSTTARVVWGVIVALGITSATVIINR